MPSNLLSYTLMYFNLGSPLQFKLTSVFRRYFIILRYNFLFHYFCQHIIPNSQNMIHNLFYIFRVEISSCINL